MKNEYIYQIETYLKSEGFEDKDLISDLKDHLATEIEQLMEIEQLDFVSSFEKAKSKLLPETPYQLEKDLKYLTIQTYSIMIKKMAYLGGYLSALSLCIALLLGAISIQDNIRSDRQQESFDARIYVQTQQLNSVKIEERQALYDKYYLEAADLKISSLKNLERSQTLLIVAILLFAITYLPYRFYDGYQNSHMEVT